MYFNIEDRKMSKPNGTGIFLLYFIGQPNPIDDNWRFSQNQDCIGSLSERIALKRDLRLLCFYFEQIF